MKRIKLRPNTTWLTALAFLGAVSVTNCTPGPDQLSCLADPCIDGTCSNELPICIENTNVCSEAPAFYNAPKLQTSDLLEAVTVADMNGDSLDDLIVDHWYTIEIFLRTGNKTFAPPVEYPSRGNALVTADFNGDGAIDIATADGSDKTISIYPNNGDGTLAPAVQYASASSTGAIVAADFNGDGKTDIAVAHDKAADVGVFLNQGNGTFSAETAFATGDRPKSLTTIDINGDGHIDLVTVSSDDTLNRLMNDGSGAFLTRIDQAYSFGKYVASADVNLDGRPDLVVATAYFLSVFLNAGGGEFAPKIDYPGYVDKFILADLNGDGRADIVGDSHDLPACAVFLNICNGSFGPQTNYLSPTYAIGCVASELTDDGLVDLVGIANSSSAVYMFENRGQGRFMGTRTHKIDYSAGSMTSADLNGDSWEDVIVTRGGQLMVFLNDRNGGFSLRNDYPMFGSFTKSVAVDVDGDGDTDIAVANSPDYDDFITIFLNNGQGTFEDGIDYSTTYRATDMIAFDADGDGLIDMARVSAEFDDDKKSLVIATNVGGYFATSATYPLPADGTCVAAMDLNNDGLMDLVAGYAHWSGDLEGLRVFLNQGGGQFVAGNDYVIPGAPHICRAANMNGNGLVDLVIERETGPILMLMGTGNGKFFNVMEVPHSGPVGSMELVDMTGDGRLDIVLGDAYGESVEIIARSANGTFEPPMTYPLAHDYDPTGYDASALIAPADFNHDCKMDLAVVHPFTDDNIVLDMIPNVTTGPCVPQLSSAP